MRQEKLPRAFPFGNALQTFVRNYFTQPDVNTCDQAPQPILPQLDPPTYAFATTVSKQESKTMKKPQSMLSMPERPLRLFLRLLVDHPARQAVTAQCVRSHSHLTVLRNTMFGTSAVKPTLCFDASGITHTVSTSVPFVLAATFLMRPGWCGTMVVLSWVRSLRHSVQGLRDRPGTEKVQAL